MAPVYFKLTKDGHTRRISFPDSPTWIELAAKLQALYGISVDNVGVSYIDTDNDEITASSNEELQEYFQSCYQPGSSIKFNVLDLSVPRGSPSPLNPQSSRNTFGQDNFEFVNAPSWTGLASYPIGDFLGTSTPSEGPHAFVEILNSDVSGVGKDNDDISDMGSVDQASTVQRISYADKGKQRSMSFGAASNISLLGEEQSQKFPIHVYDHNSKLKSSVSKSQGSDHGDIADTAEVAQVDKPDSPKVATVDDVKEPEAPTAAPTEPADPAVEDTAKETAHTDDPPLPSIDSAPASNVSAALSHDVATLLTTVSNVISIHPELSEGVRNIVTNARSGAYWHNHRTALNDAVSALRSEDIQRIEQEATRRINDALGGLFRSLSLGPDVTGAGQNQSNAPDSTIPLPNYTAHGRHPRRWNRRSGTGFDGYRHSIHLDHSAWPHEHLPMYTHASGHPTHAGPPQAPPNPPQLPPPPQHMNPVTSAGPPPPPPPPPPAAEQIKSETTPVGGPTSAPPPPPPPPGSRPKDGPPHHGPFGYPMPPPPPRPLPHVGYLPMMHPMLGPMGPVLPPPHGFPLFGGPPPFFHPPPANTTIPAANNPPPVIPAQPSSPPIILPTYNNPFSDPIEEPVQKPTEQLLREQVEETKRLYQENKQLYRKFREERKKEKDSRKNADEAGKSNVMSQDKTHEEVSQVVSQGRDGYPKLEMYSVPLAGPGPRRYNTHLGHGSSSRAIERKGDNLHTRAQIRIARRLADMGFSESTYPDLPDKIKATIPADKTMSKEAEDDAVTTLLEEMLARSTRSPGGTKGGAWH